jgi:glucose/arabinose dehydrogenase
MKPTTLLFILLAFTSLAIAQPQVSYQLFAEGFNMPVDITHAGDSRFFVAERGGTIRIISGNTILSTPFLDISSKTSVDGDRGLQSIEFDPGYAGNGYFYVYYTEKTSNLPSSGAVTIERYKVSSNPDIADASSGTVIVSINKPVGVDGTTFKDHNGGDMHFNQDGLLYFGTGDGGKESGITAPGDPYNNAQNPQSLRGKLLRIDVHKTGAKPEVVALGLRNPWRWSFDISTGDIWIGDVGHYKWEEVDHLKNNPNIFLQPRYAEANFGWRCYEAEEAYNTSVCGNIVFDMPVHKYVNQRSAGGPPASITGGYVYRGTEYPSLYGYYVCADLYSGVIHFVRDNGNGGWVNFQQAGTVTGIVSFSEGRNGELYAVSIFSGKIYKVVGENTPLLYPLPSFFVRIYPTVIHNTPLTIKSPEAVEKVEVYDMNGRLVMNKPMNNFSGSFTIDLPAVAGGMYVVRVHTKYAVRTERVIVQ